MPASPKCRNAVRSVVVLTYLSLALPQVMAGQVRPCPVPSPAAQEILSIYRSMASGFEPSKRAYYESLGFVEGAPSKVVFETDSIVCTAVTDAILRFAHAGPLPGNVLVMRNGTRLLAFDPEKPDATTFLTMRLDYTDLHFYFLCGGVQDR